MNGLKEIPYEPPCSVWSIIKSILPCSEHEVVRSLLSASLVEQADDLHSEIRCLLDIWESLHEQHWQRSIIFDQSAVKDCLIREVALLIEVIKERAEEEGKCVEEFLQKYNAKVVDFCYTSGQSTSRPTSARRTARSSSGHQTPVMSVNTETAEKVQNYNQRIQSKLQSLQPKMKVLQIQEIILVLRQILQHEVNQLKEDIVFLQQCLEDPETEPSVNEIREERNRLETDILSRSATPSIRTTSVNSSSPTLKPGRKIVLAPIKKPIPTFQLSESEALFANKRKLKSISTNGSSDNLCHSHSSSGTKPPTQPVKMNKAEKLRALVDISKA